MMFCPFYLLRVTLSNATGKFSTRVTVTCNWWRDFEKFGSPTTENLLLEKNKHD